MHPNPLVLLGFFVWVVAATRKNETDKEKMQRVTLDAGVALLCNL